MRQVVINTYDQSNMELTLLTVSEGQATEKLAGRIFWSNSKPLGRVEESQS